MKEQVTHFQNSNFKHKMKRLKFRKNLCTKNFTCMKKFCKHETAAVNLSKMYFLKNAKKTCKTNNRNLNRD